MEVQPGGFGGEDGGGGGGGGAEHWPPQFGSVESAGLSVWVQELLLQP